jgi:hypothetical protein
MERLFLQAMAVSPFMFSRSSSDWDDAFQSLRNCVVMLEDISFFRRGLLALGVLWKLIEPQETSMHI